MMTASLPTFEPPLGDGDTRVLNGRTRFFKRPLFVAVLSVLATLIICGVAGLFIYFGFGISLPEQINVSFLRPVNVKSGDSFDIEVRIENLMNRPRVLDSIDVYDGFLDGVLIGSSSPRWRSSSRFFGQFVSYDFQLAIPANGETVVKFHAQGLKPGDFMGDWDVCVDGSSSCVSEVLRTIVSD